jgi:benzoyl-CoA reductase/2-hydroxyglutaryl-CoA dehydratase subunit BcrC/BadD/HgdB
LKVRQSDIHMGYLCGNNLPYEIFRTCGIKLTKINCNGQVSSNSKVYFPTYMCSYAMNCLELFIEDRDHDGYIFENKCHAMIALYEYLREYMPHKKLFMFNTAKPSSIHAAQNYCNEISRLIKFLEIEFNISVTDQALEFNKINLINDLKQKRKMIDHIVKNSISLTLSDIEVLEKQTAEPFEIDVELKKFDERKSINGQGAEILLCGIHITPLDIIDVINEYGGKVVLYDNFENNELDNTNFSNRSETADFKQQENLTCNWNPGWLQSFENKLARYSIKGIIFSTIKFCPTQSYGVILLANLAKKRKIPFLVLNDSFSSNCSAQVRTRIQAFLECL